MIVTFTVPGLPVQQGSKRHVGNGVMIENTRAKLRPWRDSVIWAAKEAAARQGGVYFAGPVEVTLSFWFPRPKSHSRTGGNSHLLKDDAPYFKSSAPDIDKLARAVLDSLTAAEVFRDDAQVAILRAVKQYGHPGLDVTVTEATP